MHYNHYIAKLLHFNTPPHTELCIQMLAKWQMPAKDQAAVEKKGDVLGVGEPAWVKPHMRLFAKTFRMKAVDWLNLSRGAGRHIFRGHIGTALEQEPERKDLVKEAWDSILLIFYMCSTVTCNVDGEAPTPEKEQR